MCVCVSSLHVHCFSVWSSFPLSPSQLNSDNVQNTLAVQRLDLPAYLHLFVPAVEWILQCIAHQAPEVGGWDGTTGVGPLGWGRWDGTTGIGPLEWGRWDGTTGMGPLGWDSWDGAAGMGPLGWGRWDGAGRGKYKVGDDVWGLKVMCVWRGGGGWRVICTYLSAFHVQRVLEEVLSKVKENVCRYV